MSTITVKDLIERLSVEDPDLPVYFGGLNFYRCKDRGGHVHIEFNESVYRGDDGRIVVEEHDLPPREEQS